MLRVMMLMLAACLTLTACGGLNGAGEALNAPDVTPEARRECPHPSEFLSLSDWELIAGRLGDELIKCEQRRELALQAFDGQRAAIGARQGDAPEAAK